MSRFVVCICVCLIGLAPGAFAQVVPKENAPPATIALFEDDAEEFKKNLHNHGIEDASVADRSDEAFFAGTCSLTVSEFQRFNSQMPGWNFKIAENPQPGEFRYLRFAWKRTEAPGIMLQLHARPNAWHRYYAGTLSKRTQEWGVMTRVAEAVPRQWEMVTRDLFADFGPMTLTGIGLSALEGQGYAYFDHLHLGRTIEDLDRVTAALKGVVDPPPAARSEGNRWLIRGLAIAGIVAALALCLVAWYRRSRSPAAALAAEKDDSAALPVGMTSFACASCGKQLKVKGSLAGKRTRCPSCGNVSAAPLKSAGP